MAFIKGQIVTLITTSLFCLTSCNSVISIFSDPSSIGDTASCNDAAWIPPYKIKREERYCAEEIPENAPLSIAELIDYGLRNNPQTKITWNTARSNAFLLYANYNTMYPHVAITEEIELVKSHFNAGTGGARLNGGAASIINGTAALNNANNITNQNNTVSNTAVQGGTIATGGAGAVYNQFLITDLSVNYIMLDFGGRQANIEAARQALFSANWTHNRNLQTVILTIMQTYYNYLAAEATVEAQKENLRDSKNNYESAAARYQAGVSPRVDYLQARSALVNAELLLEQAYNNQNTTLGQLATSIGLSADRKIKVAPMPENLPDITIESDMAELLNKAKIYRPDLAANYSNYLNALEQVTVQFSAGMPVVSAFADYDRINFIHHPSSNGYIASGGIAITAPLFDGFLARNLTKSARAQTEAAYANYKSSEEQAFLDVVTSYYSFKTAVETVRYSKEYLEYAQEAYDVASTGYREGVNSLLDMLAATVTLANARLTFIQARTQYLTSIASLAYATGTLE